MLHITFVCYGNICRSPMAACIFRDLAEKEGFGERVLCDSAGISDEMAGSPVAQDANSELRRHGLDASEHRARKLLSMDYETTDYFLCMDLDTLYRTQLFFHGDPMHKVGFLMGYADEPAEIEDPYFTGEFAFVYEQLETGCRAFLDALRGSALPD